ncbi:MAG TPA: hypothetical protein VFX51_01405 [Solirubrobacteraceae bacterium]|nr:hypothetical protein [Solirubrobacteraceae bacterium]
MALVVLVAAVAAVAVVRSNADEEALRFEPARVGDLTLPARVEDRAIAAATADGFAPLFWAGVNLGSTIPGRQPGEVAAAREDYDRWLAGMGDLGVRVVRIYTILRPAFYDALSAYNTAHPEQPIFLMQGVWVPEEELNATGNAYDPSVTQGFEAEIADAVDVVHGDASLPERLGHAGGTYGSDVSRWLLAFSIGIEWDPNAVRSTDERNAGAEPYDGRYFRAGRDATPMESWIASMLDHTAELDAKRGWSRPLTFTNWLTLDPLEHPEEPLPQEDLVSVDATHVSATDAWPGGFFASYHAYPYYPDFMSLTERYQQYKRQRDGKTDPYAGYLHELRAHHGDQAVAITEFGVPSSSGVAHLGPIGRDQGDHSEQEALAIDADLLRDIHEEGFASGVVFEWTDEWFKFTWNTIDLELPRDRRQLWRNDLTNEEHFGVVAAEPRTEPVVTLDGRGDEWEANGSQVLAESRNDVREVRAVRDEEYLYLRLRLDEPGSWRQWPITIGLDVRPGGNAGLPGRPGVFPDADVALIVGPENAELLQAAWWEPTRIRYGLGYGYIDVDPADMKPGSGKWVHPLQILNRPQTVPSTGETRPAELHEIDSLTIADEEGFDQRTLVAAQRDVVEVRLPWALLGFADPSSLKLFVEHPDEPTSTKPAGPIQAAVVMGEDPLLTTARYGWEPWNEVAWHERRKAGFDDLADTLRDLSAAPEEGE